MAAARPQLEPWVRPREALRQLLSGATARMCVPVALVVGTLLSVVNQADVVVAGMADGAVAAKIAANYAIPFLTSSVGALLAVRERGTVPMSPAPAGGRPPRRGEP